MSGRAAGFTLAMALAWVSAASPAAAADLEPIGAWTGKLERERISTVKFEVRKGLSITMVWDGDRYVLQDAMFENGKLEFELRFRDNEVFRCSLARQAPAKKLKGKCGEGRDVFTLSMVPGEPG